MTLEPKRLGQNRVLNHYFMINSRYRKKNIQLKYILDKKFRR